MKTSARRAPDVRPLVLLAAGLALPGLSCASGGGAGAPGQTPEAPAPAADTTVPRAQLPPPPAEVPEEEAATGVRARLEALVIDTIVPGRFDAGKMWTFEFPPVDYLRAEYGFAPDSTWFRRARLGALRIPDCSASLVSAAGLVLTNHHCARESVSQVSRPGESLLDEGFYAASLAEERSVEDFHADQLIEIVDVTEEVVAAMAPAANDQERSDLRDEAIEAIEERIAGEHGGEEGGSVVEVISLYNGARFSAYRFHRYSDVRLVMAPELDIGFFGGDPDNFTYPRYNLDFALFRIYDEDGEPLVPEVYFPVDTTGSEEDELVFIVGNPGSTSRLQTVAELEFRRDVADRGVLGFIESRIPVFEEYIEGNPEEAEEHDLRNALFGLLNSRKAIGGLLEGLSDPVILARKAGAESAFLDSIQAKPALSAEYSGLADRMAEIQEELRPFAPEYRAFLALAVADYASPTLHRALLGLQYFSMRQGGADSADVAEIEEELLSVPDKPAELDEALIRARIEDFREAFGDESQVVRGILQGRSPEGAAAAIRGRSIFSDSARTAAAVASGQIPFADPALGVVQAYLARFIPFQQTVSALSAEQEEIARALGRAKFEIYGPSIPPDATFSLRIADGVVRGYPYNGTLAPPHTTFYGLYDRHFSHREEEWALPDRWLPPPTGLDLSTRLNLSTTADIIGGNSGSPVLDRDLRVVGLVFDGNMESLPGDYIYLPELNRSIAVDVRAIVEALDAIYGADRLVVELTEGRLVR